MLYNFLKKQALRSNKFSHETSVYNRANCGAGLLVPAVAGYPPPHVSLWVISTSGGSQLWLYIRITWGAVKSPQTQAAFQTKPI